MPIEDTLNVKDFRGETYVTKKGKDISVDWEGIKRLTDRNRGCCPEEVLSYLEKVGILSFMDVGNYSVTAMSGYSILNPVRNGFFLYFTREKDAKKYKKYNYKDAQYHIDISKVPGKR